MELDLGKLINLLWLIAPISAIIALLFARVFYLNLMSKDEGTPLMKEIANHVKEGANAYLIRQNKLVAIVFFIIFILLCVMVFLKIQSPFIPLLFLSGGFWSGTCGYLGMKSATNASARTANACRKSLNEGLNISFKAGSIMGLIVVGFGLLDVSIWFSVLNLFYDQNIFNISNGILSDLGNNIQNYTELNTSSQVEFQKLKFREISTILLSYGMGASIMALFSRVGGGIFTKAADVGADLVGKIEAGIPEDDPRNPATIADNVGDNVGDVAGMGADLYESYCGSILAATAIGSSLLLAESQISTFGKVLSPMIVAGAGIIFSIIAIFFVRTKENATQKELLKSLHFSTNLSAILILLFALFLALIKVVTWGIFGAITLGLISGIAIGFITEYYTSDHFKPTKNISKASQMGHATTIIEGFSVGMLSSGFPIIVISICIILSFVFSNGLNNISEGIYGISFAAIGMLSTLAVTLATDAFGPIADNAGGNAEMAGLESKVRERTDSLDSLGNTTAATGKGFAIGSAALTSLALIAAYIDSIKLWISKLAGENVIKINNIVFSNKESITENVVNIQNIGTNELLTLLNISILNPQFIVGLLLGGMTAFVFCSLTIFAVGKAASCMVEEVRRQFKEINGILEGKQKPNYASCVDIATIGAQKAMLLPSLLAIFMPIVTGIFTGLAGVLGLLIGCLSTGISLAITLNNSGGAWDNAKKYIEKGNFGGKNSNSHKASISGDTVGDPFKDTAGPSLNILLKLMTIISIVFVSVTILFGIMI